jgi:hypothetical protein
MGLQIRPGRGHLPDLQGIDHVAGSLDCAEIVNPPIPTEGRELERRLSGGDPTRRLGPLACDFDVGVFAQLSCAPGRDFGLLAPTGISE